MRARRPIKKCMSLESQKRHVDKENRVILWIPMAGQMRDQDKKLTVATFDKAETANKCSAEHCRVATAVVRKLWCND